MITDMLEHYQDWDTCTVRVNYEDVFTLVENVSDIEVTENGNVALTIPIGVLIVRDENIEAILIPNKTEEENADND